MNYKVLVKRQLVDVLVLHIRAHRAASNSHLIQHTICDVKFHELN